MKRTSTWINTKLVWPNGNGLSDRGRDTQFDGTGGSAGRPCGEQPPRPEAEAGAGRPGLRDLLRTLARPLSSQGRP